jgi:hypothetical protein
VKSSIKISSVAICIFAIVIFVTRSFNTKLWLDELFTVSLLGAGNLPDLWAAIASGLDGNPPLYMTAAWLIVHALPQTASTIAALTWLNVALTIGAFACLFRIARKLVSIPASWMAIFLFATLNDGAIYLALELRTYALYFLTTTACILFQQRLMANRRRADLILLSSSYCLLALAHTFGIVYVTCIGLSAFVTLAVNDRAAAKWSLLAMVPAVLVFACWLPFVMTQLEVANPYGWIPRPGILELVKSVFPTPRSALMGLAETACVVGFLPWYIRTRSAGFHAGVLSRFIAGHSSRPFRFACLLLLSFLFLSILAWTISRVVFPFFVARYFIPNLIISFAINLILCEFVVEVYKRTIPRVPQETLVGLFAVAPATLLAVALMYKVPLRPPIPCLDAAGAFFEDKFTQLEIPIVVESPHVWFPRAYYSPHPLLYRFPLDWDVVEKYPGRATNNATDFNLMQRFKRFAGVSSILSTEDIVRDYPQFLVVNESGRAWFHNLSNVSRVTADKLAETAEDSDGNRCTLWHVKNLQERS